MSGPRTGPLKWLHVNHGNGFALKAAVFFICNLKKLFWLSPLCHLLPLLLLSLLCLVSQIRNRSFMTPGLRSIPAALFTDSRASGTVAETPAFSRRALVCGIRSSDAKSTVISRHFIIYKKAFLFFLCRGPPLSYSPTHPSVCTFLMWRRAGTKKKN